MSTVDPLLKRLTDRVEKEALALPITLVVSGTTVTGEVVPHAVWAAHIADQLADSDSRASVFSADFAWEKDQPERDGRYLHLNGGKIVSAGAAFPEHGGLFRIGLDEVSGWFLGEIQAH
ncbi:hypothetical protein [Streptomyces beijiangensis]|uniref:Uncharacterized protein n=1 Tax=Streptomyces beijiangensis TaxID=163361 RepID=A0A939FDU6_9ACTN|nr:hypothetical protein [Streptomyces beijiangensis]MBO0515577.1 hypothetical protein [Streptomyces beijiangensis]